MARVWMTEINKRSVLQGVPTSQAIAKKKKRKNRTATKTRAIKKPRATRRAVAVGTAVQKTQGRCEDTAAGARTGGSAGARTIEAAGAITVTALQGVVPMQTSPHVTEVNAALSDTDQTAATSNASVTNQTDSGTDQPVLDPAPDWLCMICTFMNCDASATCANCKCDNASAVVDDVTPDTVQDTITVAQLAIVTDQMRTGTIRKDIDTIKKDTDTDHGSTRTDQMYYPIYGEYYTGRDVTVDVNYATTTETWRVAYINDRRQMHLGLEYRVLWVHPDRSCKRLYLRTWEPRARLVDDDFEVEIDLVDRWKASNFDTFEEFWKQDQVGFGLLGADGEGLCLFNALKRATQLAGRPDVIT
ncbi:hypothetical protein PR003_g4926 [Phytophthora rubi]|uniref:RanBP2-type domain-containing protein n=1 Tax=Phytophthora rubi TaxID=129364 RepID=A0A6A3LBT0_9STRA|nr:hypothetical protein PR002_g13913 [Phytophthora rubi]KAE9045964.1 hypothetical protein PR001_g4745 [Phytophthora rubi]KAE9351346.1 hypothetical protein PR003_g4926 [Phytophthora rubi]